MNISKKKNQSGLLLSLFTFMLCHNSKMFIYVWFWLHTQLRAVCVVALRAVRDNAQFTKAEIYGNLSKNVKFAVLGEGYLGDPAHYIAGAHYQQHHTPEYLFYMRNQSFN